MKKRIISFLVAIAVVITSLNLPIASTAATQDDGNLLHGLTAKYSNIGGNGASDIAAITDGNNQDGHGHAWIQKATGTDYMWVQFDFDSAKDINKIYLVQKWDYENKKQPLDFVGDIAVDVRLASGGWKRVAEAHNIPGGWAKMGTTFTFAKESVLSVRITANSLRNSNSDFCLVEVEGYCDESITEYSGIETLDNEVYAVPEALSDMNLVRGITATSSNNDGWFASERPISNLTDGKSEPYNDMASIGNSNDDIYEWVQLDLPQAKLVNKVVIQHRADQTTPKDFAIDVLLENGTWKRVATDYNLSSIYSPTTMTFSPEKATSIKIISNGKRAGATSMHLTEVMAYYDCSISNYTGIEKVDKSQYAIPLSSDTVNVLPGSTFTANNEYYDGWRPTNRPLGSLTDGVIEVNAGKTAMTPYNQTTGEAYINITLSEEKTINKVVINWAGYRTYEGYLGQTEDEASAAAEEKQAKDYAIDVRKKDGTWVRVVEQHNDYVKAWDTYQQTLCFEDITCTQIRITGYNANKKGSMAIMEMYAYCDSTVGTEEYTALETGVTISRPKSADWVNKTEVSALGDYAYSFAVVGDTQIVSKNDAANGTTDLANMYQYIIDKKDEYKISQVIGLGDLVDTYADGAEKEAEWDVAINAIKKLDGVLPYTLIPGNHDVNWNFNYRIGNVSKIGYLNQSQIISKYGKNEAGQTTDEPSASNTAHAFTAGGRNYLILTLEYSAKSTPGVMDWANAVVAAHPYHNVIVTTHAYLAADGSILDGSQAGSPSSYTGCENDNNGDYFWDNLIKKHDNIVMVLCGHVGVDNIVQSTKVGDKGNTVTQIMINPQDVDAEIGSTGMLAFMYFSEDGKTVQLRQYSTVWDRYYGNTSQTSFTIPVIEPIEGDVNADRDVDVRDLIRYKKYVLKTDNSVVISELTSDLNNDSEFDTDDVIVLRKMLVGIEEYDLDSNADKSIVYLSSNGKDTWTGTESQPYGTLEKALAAVQNEGTIQIQGTYKLSADYVWKNHNKTVTVMGDVLDGTALGNTISLGDHVTFDDITLEFTKNSYLFANGYSLTINENITMPNRIRVYGGGQVGSTVASTDLKLYGGSYEAVFGGSDGGTVTGNTSVVVGGNVNQGITPKHDATDYFVYGGGVADTVEGSTNVVFEGSAKAHYVFGGSYGGSATVSQGTNVYITGGTVSGVYGGSNKGAENSGVVSGGVYVEMTGGTVDQVFGGNAASDLTGDVEVKILGGTVTRRIYGGCYNEYDWGWDSEYSVKGTITLTLSGNANLTQSYSRTSGDLSIFARSRINPKSNDEVSKLIYVDGGEKHESKLGAQYASMMDSVSAYDSCETH